MKANTASQTVGAQMVSATDGSAFTGSVTVHITIDGGTQATGSVGSGACTHEGNGYHSYAPSQAETNGAHIAFTFTGTGAIPATVQVYTTFPQTGDSFARLGAPAGASLSADVAAVKTQTAAIETDTQDLQTQIGTAGAGLTAINLPDQTMNITGNITGNLSGSVGSVTGAVGSVTGNVGGTVNGLTATAQGNVRTAVGLASANLDTQLGTIDANVDAVLVDTGTTLDGKLDTIDTVVDAIKAKTDSLTFTVAGQVDANIQSINDVTITGNGATGTEFSV